MKRMIHLLLIGLTLICLVAIPPSYTRALVNVGNEAFEPICGDWGYLFWLKDSFFRNLPGYPNWAHRYKLTGRIHIYSALDNGDLRLAFAWPCADNPPRVLTSFKLGPVCFQRHYGSRYDVCAGPAFADGHVPSSTNTVVNAFAIRLWLLATLLACFPTIAFGRGIICRYRFRTSGKCFNCDYDLTGNTSGICSECGTPISKQEAAS